MNTLHKYPKFLWVAVVLVIALHYGTCFIPPRRQAAFNPPRRSIRRACARSNLRRM
jgi:hypothetical protein